MRIDISSDWSICVRTRTQSIFSPIHHLCSLTRHLRGVEIDGEQVLIVHILQTSECRICRATRHNENYHYRLGPKAQSASITRRMECKRGPGVAQGSTVNTKRTTKRKRSQDEVHTLLTGHCCSMKRVDVDHSTGKIDVDHCRTAAQLG